MDTISQLILADTGCVSYLIYCKKENEWYRFNDNNINKIDDITEIDEDINMLFYKIII